MSKLSQISSFFLRARHHRAIAATVVGLITLAGWGVEGTQIISTLNPTFGRELAIAAHPPLSVWITLPDYAAAKPMIISTPAGVRFEEGTITVPQGSIVSAHLAEQDGDAPELVVNGDSKEFTTDEHGDFAATQSLTSGDKIIIRRGWLTLASWKVKIIADAPPKIAMDAPPLITESKTIRLSYSASDDFGVKEIALRITPHNPLPGSNNAPVEIVVPTVEAKQISHVDFEDLTARPWAGQKVTMQLVATNDAGKRSLSDAVDFVIPERNFFHPVARVLIEERKKLLEHPTDEALREETANIMAAIAHETADFHGDPVVLMALRSGAVRLILDRDLNAAVSVNDLLWQAATRIEDGNAGTAQHKLRDAQQDLANAISHNAEQAEIDELTNRLQQAIGIYISNFTAHSKPAHGFVENTQIAK